MIYRDTDGIVERLVYAEPDGTVSSVLRQPSRDALLELNARCRIEAPLRELSFCRLVLRIPVVDRERLRATHPELDAPDKDIRNSAWARFIASSESTPFKVGTNGWKN